VCLRCLCLQCFDAVGWATGRASGQWWGAGVVICLARGAYLHMPTWSHCHSLSLAPVKSRLVLPFWYRLTRVVPDKGPLNVCVCVSVCVCVCQRERLRTHSVCHFPCYSDTGPRVPDLWSCYILTQLHVSLFSDLRCCLFLEWEQSLHGRHFQPWLHTSAPHCRLTLFSCTLHTFEQHLKTHLFRQS